MDDKQLIAGDPGLPTGVTVRGADQRETLVRVAVDLAVPGVTAPKSREHIYSRELMAADVETIVDLERQGSCSSCAISGVTLQGGVSRILHDRLPWVTGVVGGVDDTISTGRAWLSAGAPMFRAPEALLSSRLTVV